MYGRTGLQLHLERALLASEVCLEVGVLRGGLQHEQDAPHEDIVLKLDRDASVGRDPRPAHRK